MAQIQFKELKEKTQALTMVVKIKFYLCAIITVLLISCNNPEKCNKEIVEIQNSFFQNKKMYNFILEKFIEDNYTIKNDLNQYLIKFKINSIWKCRDFEEGEYIINFKSTEQCVGVIQSVNLMYSKNQLRCKKTTKIEIKQLDKNWYIVIIRD